MEKERKRVTFTKEEKRLKAEESTRIAFELAEKERMAREKKTARLRALRQEASGEHGARPTNG